MEDLSLDSLSRQLVLRDVEDEEMKEANSTSAAQYQQKQLISSLQMAYRTINYEHSRPPRAHPPDERHMFKAVGVE